MDPHHQILLGHLRASELNYVSRPAPTVSGDATDLGNAGISAAALFGAVLLGTRGVLVGRKRLARA